MKTTESVNTKILLKSSFWYVVSNFLTRGLVFITTPIFTRLMTTKQYGNFSVFASWQSTFLIICGLEIYATLNRARFDYKEEGELDSYITSCLVLSSMITAVVLVLYLLFPEFFHRLLLLDQKYILIMFAYLFAQPVFLMFQAKQRVEYKYKLSSAISFALVVGSSLIAVALVYWLEDDRLLGRIIVQGRRTFTKVFFFSEKKCSHTSEILEICIDHGAPFSIQFPWKSDSFKFRPGNCAASVFIG